MSSQILPLIRLNLHILSHQMRHVVSTKTYIIIGLYINMACPLYPINVITTEPIGPKFCGGPHPNEGLLNIKIGEKNLENS